MQRWYSGAGAVILAAAVLAGAVAVSLPGAARADSIPTDMIRPDTASADAVRPDAVRADGVRIDAVSTDATHTDAVRPRFGISMPSFRENRWQLDMQAFQNDASARGVDIIVRFAGNDPAQQNLQIKEMVNIGIDALIVAPTDVFACAEGVAYAKDRRVPVISYDRLAENCDVDTYVAFEREGVGDLMGRYLASRVPRGNYILLRGPAADSNAKGFFTGAMEHIEPLVRSGAVTVLFEGEVAGWRADVAEALVDGVLEKTVAVNAVLAPNDDTAGGVIRALQRKGLAGAVYVTGQDATPDGLARIADGLQGMTVFKNTNDLAREASVAALEAVREAARETAGRTGRVERRTPDTLTPNGFGDIPTFVRPVMFVDKESLPYLLRLPEMD